MTTSTSVAASTPTQIDEGPYVVRAQLIPGVVRLTMNRPKAFNSLSEEMLTALQAEFDQIAKDASVRMVVLAASGKAFCAGHDLKQMRAKPTLEYYQGLFEQCSKLMLAIQNLPVPVLARVQGIATAAGCQLVSMCDLAIATDQTRFAVSGINYGLFCSTPSVGLSRNMHRKQAMEMLLTGDFIDALTAQERGLINQVVSEEQLDQAVLALCQKIIAKPAVAIATGKGLFYKQLEAGIEEAYVMAGQAMACNMMDESALEGFSAFIEKRDPSWKPKH